MRASCGATYRARRTWERVWARNPERTAAAVSVSDGGRGRPSWRWAPPAGPTGQRLRAGERGRAAGWEREVGRDLLDHAVRRGKMGRGEGAGPGEEKRGLAELEADALFLFILKTNSPIFFLVSKIKFKRNQALNKSSKNYAAA